MDSSAEARPAAPPLPPSGSPDAASQPREQGGLDDGEVTLIRPASSPIDREPASTMSRLVDPLSPASDDSAAPAVVGPGRSPVAVSSVLAGRRLNHFRLGELIGGGGMGAVFRARDERLDRVVAVKVIPFVADDPELQRRFRNEAQAAAKLDHPRIARVFEVGNDGPWHYIVFEYIDGDNVRDAVTRDGPMDLDAAIAATMQVAEALAHASRRGIVHRDIKPSNVVLMPDGNVKLVDMGLARSDAIDRGTDDMTATGVTLGTFDYLAPEQARDPRIADVRSDLYSLGCTLYYMLTGVPPYPDGTMLQKLLNHGGAPVPDIRARRPELPPRLTKIVNRLLAKQSDDRYRDPMALFADLHRLAVRCSLPRSRAMRPGGTAGLADERSWLQRRGPAIVTIAASMLLAVGINRWFTQPVPMATVHDAAVGPGTVVKGLIQPDVGETADPSTALPPVADLNQPSVHSRPTSDGGIGFPTTGGIGEGSTVGSVIRGGQEPGQLGASILEGPDAARPAAPATVASRTNGPSLGLPELLRVPDSLSPAVPAETPSIADIQAAGSMAANKRIVTQPADPIPERLLQSLTARLSDYFGGVRKGIDGPINEQSEIRPPTVAAPTNAASVTNNAARSASLTELIEVDATADRGPGGAALPSDSTGDLAADSGTAGLTPPPLVTPLITLPPPLEPQSVQVIEAQWLDDPQTVEESIRTGRRLVSELSEAIELAESLELPRVELAVASLTSRPVQLHRNLELVSVAPEGTTLRFDAGPVAQQPGGGQAPINMIDVGGHRFLMVGVHCRWKVPPMHKGGGGMLLVNENPSVVLRDCSLTIQNPDAVDNIDMFRVVTNPKAPLRLGAMPPADDAPPEGTAERQTEFVPGTFGGMGIGKSTALPLVSIELSNTIIRGGASMVGLDVAADLQLRFDNGLVAINGRLLHCGGSPLPTRLGSGSIRLSLNRVTSVTLAGVAQLAMDVRETPYPIRIDRVANGCVFVVPGGVKHFDIQKLPPDYFINDADEDNDWLKISGADNTYSSAAIELDPLLVVEDTGMGSRRYTMATWADQELKFANETASSWLPRWSGGPPRSMTAEQLHTAMPREYLLDGSLASGFDFAELPTIPIDDASTDPTQIDGSSNNGSSINAVNGASTTQGSLSSVDQRLSNASEGSVDPNAAGNPIATQDVRPPN